MKGRKREREDAEEVKVREESVETACLKPHPVNPLKAKLARGEVSVVFLFGQYELLLRN